ncbi:MAG: ribonuclease E/G, partial [Candidatus Bathyarchaeota archaeon]
MAKVRVRGIYSTALTKLLLDNNFEVVHPSAKIVERFDIEEKQELPDLAISDRRNRQGVYARGRLEPLNVFCSILRSHLDDAIIRRWAFTIGGIYLGKISQTDSAADSVLVDIGPATSRIYREEMAEAKSKQIVVQAKSGLGRRKPLLTANITISGKYAVLIFQHMVKVSKRLFDFDERSRLLQLGENLTPPKWGIIWRRTAANQTDKALKSDVVSLVKEGERVLKKAEQVEAPALLLEGSHLVNVEFPALSKAKMDEIRGSVTPTMRKHHYCKACGERVSSALEMAEISLEKGQGQKEVEEFLTQAIEREYPAIGSSIDIEHVKPNGKVLHLGEALIQNLDHNASAISVHLRRNFKNKGMYDGLNIPKEPDDYAVTMVEIGEWYFKTQYFSSDGQLKGTYVNLNTPIELYPHGIRYVDLEVDVCLWPDGRVEKLDEEKLEKAVEEGLVSEKLANI